MCHQRDSAEKHQDIYNEYADATRLGLTILSVESVAGAEADTFDSTLTFTVTKNGLPFVDADGLGLLNQKRFMGLTNVDGEFTNPISFRDPMATATAGEYTATAIGVAYALEDQPGAVYGYIGDEPLDTESGGHVHMYGNVANAALTFNAFDVNASAESAANVSGCEKCHGAPYMKHGYRAAAVEGLGGFDSCRFCHYDGRNGRHEDWQILVDDPLRYTGLDEVDVTDEEAIKYAYEANLMNDVHMSHAMEFPYPQSMANCVTCHEGKLDIVLADEHFQIGTCKSCHAVDGNAMYGTRDLALTNLLPEGHNLESQCDLCHTTGGFAPAFSAIHSGYDKKIFAADDVKYAEWFTASVDAASLDANLLTVTFSVTEDAASDLALDPEDVIPTIMIGLYGYNTSQFIVAPHGRDADRNRFLEFKVDGVTENPRFNVVSAANGEWTITADISMWADKLEDGSVIRAEIAITPSLEVVVGELDSDENGEDDDFIAALNAPSRTFDLVTNDFDDGYFPEITSVDKCNDCHGALGTTFHSGSRGGNIAVCKMCHVTTSGGSHLEMQSRAIDSYVHAIHTFQDFDSGDIDMADPVEKLRYEHHVDHVFPNFTIKNCEACHNPGTYGVPDQSKSLPGLLSGSDTWALGRNIGDVPAMITGPAARACGGCHRAKYINEDNAGQLASWNQHTKSNGYLVESVPGLLDMIIARVMSQF